MKNILLGALVILFVASVGAGVQVSNAVAIQQHTIDSLQTELFQSQSQSGKYEMAFELFKEKYPTAAIKFTNILNNETE
jgi:Tfp pilus assembly protein PilN